MRLAPLSPRTSSAPDEFPQPFLRRHAIDAGLTDAALRRAVRSGELARIRVGAYVDGPTWRAASLRQQHCLLMRAVHLTHLGRVAFSHHSAAVLHGMELWDVDLRSVHVTRSDGTEGRHSAGITHHQGLLLPEHVQTVDGLPVVSAARAALESASLVDVERGLVVVESGLRSGLFDLPELRCRYDEIKGWPGSLGLQLVLGLADERHGSLAETRLHHLIWRAALPPAVPQYEIYDGDTLIATVDFAWPDLGVILEFDGKVKYEKYLRDGESPADAVFREKRREDRIREVTGWVVVRVTWWDLQHPEQLVARIRRALATGRSRR